MRIHELAKELSVKSKELVDALGQMGYEGLTASSSVPDEAVPRLRASGGKAVPAGKPKVVTEQQLPSRPRPKPKPEPKPAAKEKPAEADGQAAPEAAPAEAPPAPEAERETVRVPRGSTVKDVAEKLGVGPMD